MHSIICLLCKVLPNVTKTSQWVLGQFPTPDTVGMRKVSPNTQCLGQQFSHHQLHIMLAKSFCVHGRKWKLALVIYLCIVDGRNLDSTDITIIQSYWWLEIMKGQYYRRKQTDWKVLICSPLNHHITTYWPVSRSWIHQDVI